MTDPTPDMHVARLTQLAREMVVQYSKDHPGTRLAYCVAALVTVIANMAVCMGMPEDKLVIVVREAYRKHLGIHTESLS